MKQAAHKWTFRARFRRNAFGWRSQTPIKRIREAVSEIKKVARKEPVVAAEGAVLLLEKLSPAIESVDSSSGAIGAAVNNAIATLAGLIADAPADMVTRGKWLERLWQAVQDDDMPYLELLPEYWGEMCVTPELASRWADEFIDMVRRVWSPDSPPGVWFKGTQVCLSALHQAKRYDELMALIALEPYESWSSRYWGVKALVAQGKRAEAIQYAESTSTKYVNPISMALTCEEILLANGSTEEAYVRYAMVANRRGTNLATFRAVSAKYPHKPSADILRDLVAHAPGEEGKWFAAAKSVGLYDEAIALANRTPCDPRTLTRAARDMVDKNASFAMEAGLTAIRWIVTGHAYDITAADVVAAYRYTIDAATKAKSLPAARVRIQGLLASAAADAYAAGILRSVMEREPTTNIIPFR
jgi:hypothetical protein